MMRSRATNCFTGAILRWGALKLGPDPMVDVSNRDEGGDDSAYLTAQ
jgi:hypothetical protein